MKTLELNFDNAATIDQCLVEISAESPVPFVLEKFAPRDDWTAIMAIPEYASVKARLILTFASDSACRQFMRDKRMREIFDRHAP